MLFQISPYHFWGTIPELWLAPVVVVNRIEHQILVVPTECAIFHANIKPRYVDTRNVFGSLKLHERIMCFMQVA